MHSETGKRLVQQGESGIGMFYVFKTWENNHVGLLCVTGNSNRDFSIPLVKYTLHSGNSFSTSFPD